MYVVIILSLGTSLMGLVTVSVFGLTFAQRWMEIRGPQLAPKVPKN